MGIKKMIKYFILICFVAFSIGFSCDRRITCNQTIYTFATNMVAYPDLDSINLNDTIWVEYNQSTTFIDLQTGLNIDYRYAENFGIGLTFDKFIGGSVSNPGTIPAVSAFSTVLAQGFELSSLQPNRIKSFNFLEEGGRYKFKIAIIVKDTGIFSVSISNAANVYRKNDKCTKAGFEITFANTNQHLYFYEQNRPGYTPSQYERTHMYCFKVK